VKFYLLLLYLFWCGGGSSKNPLDGGLALPASPEPHTPERLPLLCWGWVWVLSVQGR